MNRCKLNLLNQLHYQGNITPLKITPKNQNFDRLYYRGPIYYNFELFKPNVLGD